MALAWEEYGYLEKSVEQLRVAFHGHLATPQVRAGSAECSAEVWVEVRRSE